MNLSKRSLLLNSVVPLLSSRCTTHKFRRSISNSLEVLVPNDNSDLFKSVTFPSGVSNHRFKLSLHHERRRKTTSPSPQERHSHSSKVASRCFDHHRKDSRFHIFEMHPITVESCCNANIAFSRFTTRLQRNYHPSWTLRFHPECLG